MPIFVKKEISKGWTTHYECAHLPHLFFGIVVPLFWIGLFCNGTDEIGIQEIRPCKLPEGRGGIAVAGCGWIDAGVLLPACRVGPYSRRTLRFNGTGFRSAATDEGYLSAIRAVTVICGAERLDCLQAAAVAVAWRLPYRKCNVQAHAQKKESRNRLFQGVTDFEVHGYRAQ